jgi:hypothetical protein
VLDFTGELLRAAVAAATARDTGAVLRAKEVVDSLQGQFLQMDLRNGAVRKKYDTLKYTLRKLEVCASGWRGVAWRGMAWRGVAWRGVACEQVTSVWACCA